MSNARSSKSLLTMRNQVLVDPIANFRWEFEERMFAISTSTKVGCSMLVT
jgi:hypothetical protein